MKQLGLGIEVQIPTERAHLPDTQFAFMALWDIAIKNEFITCDDLSESLIRAGRMFKERRNVGLVFRRAESAGIIQKDSRHITSRRRHAAPILTWKSLIYCP